jgi:serine phosphatase RsbU (regulator of sigma subunit)
VFLFVALSIAALAPIVYLGLTQAARWREVQRRDADKELRFAAEGLARTLGQALDANVREITSVAKTVGMHGTGDRSVVQQLLHEYCATFPSCLGVNVTDLEGMPVVIEPQDAVPRKLADRDYYQAMRRTGHTIVSGVELGRLTKVPTIHVCAPIWAAPLAGEPTFAGAVVGATGLGYLQELTTKSVEIFGDTHAQVIDGHGRVVLDSSPAGAPALADRSANPTYLGVAAGQTILRDGQDEQGKRVRIALERVPEQGVDWTVAVMRQTQLIEEQANRARVSTLIAVAAALVLGFVFAYILSAWLARPISKLARYATGVAKGEPLPMPARGALDAREVTQLIETVFSMVSQLQQQTEALREREEEQIVLARIRKELDIAERIQTGILPKQCTLPGFESAARMIPAEAVGGDYYEILPTASGFWIASGDVSGHGLNAGLVMLMLQSALAALAIYAPAARPAELLKAANRLLVENIRRRLGGDDHATLVLMHVDLDGSFVFAGGHEPLLIFRAKSGKCEVIDTPGPWMGIIPDIGRQLSEGCGRLEPGDLLLFHSDGVVESGAREHKPYGLERLCSAVERLADQPAEVVCGEILREAEEWSSGRREDDMTVVVVRRDKPDAPPRTGLLQ